MAAPDLVEIAEDWLSAKLAQSSASNPANSDRARRGDLARWGRTIAMTLARDVEHRDTQPLSIADDLGLITLDDLTAANLVRALGALRASGLSLATCRRMIATMRTFCGWMTKKGYLTADPSLDDEFAVPARDLSVNGQTFHYFELNEVEAMLHAAGDPPPTATGAWAERDVAMLTMLAKAGLRAAECVGLHVADVTLDGDPAMVHVRRGAKGSKTRDIPAARVLVDAVERYLTDRALRAETHPVLAVSPASPLFVRLNGTPLSTQALDRIIRRVAAQAGVELRQDAAAHGFRHHLGVQLALRGVPVPVIQEVLGHSDPRTTSIYMRIAGRHVADALEDAGWM